MNMLVSPGAETKPSFAELRRTMVDCQIRTFGVTDRAVIARFLDVPREEFVPAELRALAYSDLTLKIGAVERGGWRQLLAPMVLARLMQEADVKPEEKILDIAAGTGYSTAILAGLAQGVTALEEDSNFQAMIASNLAAIGLDKVPVTVGALTDGVANKAPFDLIFINGAVEGHLDKLFAQLREGGRLITLSRSVDDPNRYACHALLFEKIAGQTSSRILFDASAPLLSAFREEPHFVFQTSPFTAF
jgi:protein-L-isoaspartate(D-aspartate) O-methyltransferase